MKRIEFELKRQFLHILFGILVVYFFYAGVLIAWMILCASIAGLIISLVCKKYKIPIISHLLRIFERKENLKKFPGKGVIFYLLGSFFAIVLFPRDIAAASIMILALGDSFSRLVGPFGRILHPFDDTKFVEGLVAGAIAGFVGASVFVKPMEAIIASTISMFIEGFDLKIKGFKIDDNLIIPLVAGAVIWAMRTF